MNIKKSISKIVFKFNELFKTDVYFKRMAHLGKEALKNNEWDSFVKYCPKKNIHASYQELVEVVVKNDDINIFSKFETKAKADNDSLYIDNLFYCKVLIEVMGNDSIEIFKYLDKKYGLDEIERNSNLNNPESSIFIRSCKYRAAKIMDYLLFDKKVTISQEEKDWVEHHLSSSIEVNKNKFNLSKNSNIENKLYPMEVLDLIKSRDSFIVLNDKLEVKVKSNKKIKI